jgi:hypothetical protein
MFCAGGKTRAVWGGLLLLVGALAAGNRAVADVFPPGVIVRPTPEHFSVCYTGGCDRVASMGLSPAQRRRLGALFVPRPRGPAQERARIAAAVGLLERITGKALGTDRDLGGTFAGLGLAGQMDCIDESVNTTTYMGLLARMGLLRWHRVEDRVTRGFFIFGWPHTTAVIRDISDDRLYAVDSWFEANGTPPYIVPLRRWRDGWRPSPAEKRRAERPKGTGSAAARR